MTSKPRRQHSTHDPQPAARIAVAPQRESPPLRRPEHDASRADPSEASAAHVDTKCASAALTLSSADARPTVKRSGRCCARVHFSCPFSHAPPSALRSPPAPSRPLSVRAVSVPDGRPRRASALVPHHARARASRTTALTTSPHLPCHAPAPDAAASRRRAPAPTPTSTPPPAVARLAPAITRCADRPARPPRVCLVRCRQGERRRRAAATRRAGAAGVRLRRRCGQSPRTARSLAPLPPSRRRRCRTRPSSTACRGATRR